jgi:glycosyltransferase involved in cell wall biosynthesis
MREIFLEAHNLKNRYSGFGQFNYHLIKGLINQPNNDLRFIVHSKNIDQLKEDFGSAVGYRKYHSLSRHKLFRIRKRYDLWHSLNQNIKIEPYHNIPYVLTVHDIHFVIEAPESERDRRIALFKGKLKRSHAITYISDFVRNDTHNHFDVPKVPEYVIPNGNTIVQLEIPENYRPPVSPPAPFLYSIGDFTPRKNFKSLVELLSLLPGFSLVLSGSHHTAYGEELKALISKYGLQDRVLLTGKVADLEKKYYLKHCEAFVFPSLREGFGIPPVEAMAYGKPVFIPRNTSLPEVGGEHAFYWDNYEPDHMKAVFDAGMEKVYANPEFYRKWYTERAASFSWDRAAAAYLEVYRNTLK